MIFRLFVVLTFIVLVFLGLLQLPLIPIHILLWIITGHNTLHVLFDQGSNLLIDLLDRAA